MLARKYKIGIKNRIEQIMKKGYRSSTRLFQMRFLRNRLNQWRFSLVVPSKMCKTAVARNLLRRRIYEAIRLHWNLGKPPCYDVVVLLSRKSADATYLEIVDAVQYGLRKFPQL